MAPSRSRWTVSRNYRSAVCLAVLLAGMCLLAPPLEAQRPAYPKVTLSTWYKVDPTWPARPASCAWGDVPGVAVDAKDQVWVYTRAAPPVQVYQADGKFVRSWGEGQIRSAHHIRFARDGNVWLADVGDHAVYQFTPEGKLLRTLGTKGVAGDDASHFNQPTDMAVTPAGDVFVSDGYGNSRVARFDRQGNFVKAWGRLGTKPGEFSLVHSITLDSKGRLYVADRNNARVQVFDQDGRFLAQWKDLVVPWGLWMTPADEVWVCGSSPMEWRPGDENCGIPPKDQLFLKLDTEGRVLQLWTIPKGEDGREKAGELNWVHGIAADSRGNLYAGDIKGKRAQKFVRQE